MDPKETARQTGHPARKLNRQFRIVEAERELYRGSVPVVENGARRFVDFPIKLPHEILAQAYAEDPASFRRHVADDFLVPNLVNHALTIEAGGPDKITPVGLFVDGVGFSKRDSFVGYFVGCTNVQQTYVCCVLRKADLCDCGCKGRCSFGAVDRILQWSFHQLAGGYWPHARHAHGSGASDRQT
jgi:hypothetical protein